MAKLSARGRKELVRVEKEESTPDGELTVWSRTTLALMSDLKVLKKLDVRFKSDDRPYSYGWKVYGKAKADLTADRFVEVFAKKGFVRS